MVKPLYTLLLFQCRISFVAARREYVLCTLYTRKNLKVKLYQLIMQLCPTIFKPSGPFSQSPSAFYSYSLSVSLSPSVFLSLSLSISLSICHSSLVSLALYLYLINFPSLFLSLSICLLFLISHCLSLSLWMSFYSSIYLSLSVCHSFFVSLALYLYLIYSLSLSLSSPPSDYFSFQILVKHYLFLQLLHVFFIKESCMKQGKLKP